MVVVRNPQSLERVRGAGSSAGGDDAGAADAGVTDAGAADADPSCDLSRGDNVYTGCGYVYQKESDAIQQCGTGQPLPFIWDGAEMSGCGINRGDNVYTGCGYVYQKESDAIQQCGTGQPLPFIPTGQ